jgi:hypothetical protein
MQLDPVELKRLASMQREPLLCMERRIEEAELIDHLHYAVSVTQQFTVPFLSKQDKKQKAETKSDKHLLVPLGWFAKDRLPDIKVLDEDGSRLPFLRRRDQGRVGATLFAGHWKKIISTNLPQSAENDARAIWKMIQTNAERVITNDRRTSQAILYDLRQALGKLSTSEAISPDIRCFLLTILANGKFWRSFKTLAEVRLLFAEMRGRPERTYVLTVKYTERLPSRPTLPPTRRRVARQYAFRHPGFTVRRFVRRFFGWLGVGGTGFSRKAINLGQAASFWIIFIVPEGVEPIRCFWRSASTEAPAENAISVERTKAAAGKYQEPGRTVEPDELALDVQIEQSSAIASAAGLAALLYFVGVYVYKSMPHLIAEQRLNPNSNYVTRLLGIASILAATPATIAGALAYRGHTFVRYVNRGPRLMLALLSAQGAFLAVVISLHGPGDFPAVLAFILSIYSLVITGIFLYIRFGSRWRKNERSRRQQITSVASPFKCRQRQAYDALFCLLPWLLFVLLVACTQAALQRQHVFGSHFPGNVWHVWVPALDWHTHRW